MCLLKRDNKDTNCGHEECRNYYLMNKQLCVHNPNQSPIQNNLLNNPSILLQNQNQQRSFVPSTVPYNIDMQQILNNKRSSKPPESVNSDDTGITLLNKKKFKPNDENVSTDYQPSQKSVTETPVNLNELGVSPLQLSGVFNKQALFNNQLLNNFLIANNQPNMLKPADVQFTQLGDMMGNVFQAPQMGNLFENANNMQHMNSFMSPAMKKQGNGQGDIAIESRIKTEQDAECELFLKEFQTKTLGLLFSQNKMLMDLKEKNEVVQDTLACLIGEVNTLKKLIDQQPPAENAPANNNPLIAHQIIGNSSETGSMEGLMNYLYGPRPEFNHYLVLKNEFPLPLYRERNFKFTVVLVDQNGNIVENSNRIPLAISIYSSENPPKYIDSNTAGNKILKGFAEKDLVNGSVTFEKIQIKEVTSHFRNGWVFFVVHPKLNKTSNNNVLMGNNGVVTDASKIKPLILEKVIVKAKKTKEKENLNAEGSPSSPQNESPKENVFE